MMIAKGLQAKLSARNVIGETVSAVQDDAVDSEETLKLSGGINLVAIIARRALSHWG
jgi:molybdopterin-binding protein